MYMCIMCRGCWTWKGALPQCWCTWSREERTPPPCWMHTHTHKTGLKGTYRSAEYKIEYLNWSAILSCLHGPLIECVLLDILVCHLREMHKTGQWPPVILLCVYPAEPITTTCTYICCWTDIIKFACNAEMIRHQQNLTRHSVMLMSDVRLLSTYTCNCMALVWVYMYYRGYVICSAFCYAFCVATQNSVVYIIIATL